MALSSSVKVEQAHLKGNHSSSEEQHEEAQGQMKSPQNMTGGLINVCVRETRTESISAVIFLIITVTRFR